MNIYVFGLTEASEMVPKSHLGPKMAQDGPKMDQDGPKMVQDGLKMAPRWPKIAQDGPKIARGEPQDGSQMGAGRPKTLIFLRFFAVFAIGPSFLQFRLSFPSLRHLVFLLGFLGVILGLFSTPLRPSWGRLGPSWGLLGPKMVPRWLQDGPKMAQDGP